MLSVFCSPGRYTQGRGATAALGREMAALGLAGPALVIASKSVIAQLSGTWKSSLDEAGIHHVIQRFGGECTLVEIERLKDTALRCQAQTIVGAGGGKVLDTARAVAADLQLPVVNCPTVASSDAFGLLVQLVLEGATRSIMEQVLSFACDVGLPITLADIGLAQVVRDRIQQVAARATAPGETIHNEPFEVTAEMVVDSILAADSIGRGWRKQYGVK